MTMSSDNRGGVTWEKEIGNKGEFLRRPTTFRNWIREDGSTMYQPEASRYHLIVSYACPWAHRVLLVRKLKGLEDAISVTVVHHHLTSDGWHFVKDGDEDVPVDCTPDPILGARFLSEIYYAVEPDYEGRFTVPLLFDTKTRSIVNNESKELIAMLNSECNGIAKHPEVDLAPIDRREEIDQVAEDFYNSVNNGVYRCGTSSECVGSLSSEFNHVDFSRFIVSPGFARTQAAYDQAINEVFQKLDELEARLSKSPFLLGSDLTLADIRLFTTLYRFDAVYVGHFKCNIRRR